MKGKAYKRKVDTCNEMRGHIMDVIARIKECQDALRRTTCHVLTQVAKCIDVDSRIFEKVPTLSLEQ
jgi:hypothetical protein